MIYKKTISEIIKKKENKIFEELPKKNDIYKRSKLKTLFQNNNTIA